MPTPTTKKRQELCSRFVSNAIPTEGDYADLIAASLNQAEDGLLKLPNQPLALLAPKQPPEKVNDPIALLNVFADPAAADPSWQLQLKAGDKPGIGLADHRKNTRLFLDGTTGNLEVAGNLGVGTAAPAQRLTVEGPWNAGKDPANSLSNAGQLAIKGPSAQLDFIDSDPNQTDWAIHVNEGKLSFVRSPDNKDLVIDDKGNVGIGTDTPTAKLHVAGNMCMAGALELRGDLTLTGTGRLPLRRVWFATANTSYEHGPPNGLIAGSRTLKIKKEFNHSILRIVYCDNHQAVGGDTWCGARWEVRLYGNTSARQDVYDQHISLPIPIYLDRAGYKSANPSVLSAIVGFARSIPRGIYEIRVHISAITGPGNTLAKVGTGWDGSTWSLEAEEILQNTL
jgi:hypothetical protein